MNLLDRTKAIIKSISNNDRYLYLSLSFIVVLIHSPYIFANKPGTDEAMFIVCSSLVKDGFRLYSEIYSMYPPVFIYLLAGITKIFGVNLSIIRLVMAIINSISVIYMYRISRSMFTKEVSLLSALLMCIFISHPYFGWYYARTDSLMLAFALCGLSYSLSAESNASSHKNLYAGIMIGLSFMSKQTGFLFFPLYIFSVYVFNHGKSSISNLLPSLFFFVLGFIAPFFAFSLFFISNNSFESFFNQVLIDSLNGGPGSSLVDSNIINIRIFIPLFQMFTKFPLIFVLGLGAFLAKFVEMSLNFKSILIDSKETESNPKFFSEYINKNKSDIILMAWFITILMFYLLTSIRQHYLFYILPPVCLKSSHLIVVLLKYIKVDTISEHNSFGDPKKLASILVMLSLSLSLIPEPYPTDFVGKDSIYVDTTLEESSNYIKINTDKDDKIYTFSYYPEIYIQSNRQPASTLYFTIYDGIVEANDPGEVSDHILKDIKENKPVYIITIENNEATSINGSVGRWFEGYSVVIDYILENYHVEKIFYNNDEGYPNGDLYLWTISKSQ